MKAKKIEAETNDVSVHKKRFSYKTAIILINGIPFFANTRFGPIF